MESSISQHHPKQYFEGIRSRSLTNLSMRESLKKKKKVALTDSSPLEELNQSDPQNVPERQKHLAQKRQPPPHYRGMNPGIVRHSRQHADAHAAACSP